MPIWAAFALALAGILLVACAFIVGVRWLERATMAWTRKNRYALIAERPWYVRFCEFLNSEEKKG